MIRTWIIAWAVGAALLAAGGLLVIEDGLFDATATTPHSQIVAWATHTAFVNSVTRESAGVRAPPAFTADEVRAGFGAYHQDCEMCHGGPGVPRAVWASGMTPTPPFIIDAARRFSPAQLYWIVDHGVKMTAMPAWRGTESEGRIWDIVAFLQSLPYLSARQYRQLSEPPSRP